jgi:aldose 1-epimerase
MRSHLFVSALALVLATAGPGLAAAPTATRGVFGKLADGRTVDGVTLFDGHGLKVRIMTLGAAIQSLEVPDRAGHAADVVLGYDAAADYLAKPKFYGATVGRYANRIAHAVFSLDGRSYPLPNNDGANLLHGGPEGFDKRIWSIVKVEGGPKPSVTLSYVSPDGEEGFPGALKVEATYALIGHGQLSLTYRATTDKPTVVNISNHSYFNLAGEGADESLLDQSLTIPADRYTPVDAALIPTGELRPVAGTPFDFRKATKIGLRVRDGTDQQILYGRGVDHNYVLNAGASGAAGPLHLAARLADPRSGRVMEILSNQPGVQVYTGNFIDALTPGKKGHLYRQGDGICLEPQLFPDTPNQPRFPTARLDPGQTYLNRIVYRFSVSPR